MVFLIQQTITYTLPLIIVALAGVFAERSGIINLALEGIMIMGAFIGVIFIRAMEDTAWITGALANQDYLSFQLLEILTMLVTAVAGAGFSYLLSFAAIKMKGDQTIIGTAMNMMAPALVLYYLAERYGGISVGLKNLDSASMFLIKKTAFGFEKTADIGFFGTLFLHKVYLATYLCAGLIVALSVILYKTRFGLRMRSCGENPEAAASLGINVFRMRYAGTAISGALAGMGGFIYALTTAGCTANGDVAGFGFLALSVMIFGNWKPLPIVGAALVFGFFKCIAASYFTLDLNKDGVYALANLGISSHVYRMLPFVITMIVLAFTSRKSRAPKAEGKPFELSE